MEEALRAYLIADTALSALISTRLAWGVNDQGGAMPRVTLQVISGSPEYSDEGESGISENRVQVDCFASTYASAKAVARAISARISGASFTQGSVRFNIFIDSERDDAEAFDGGREVHRVSMDLMVWHTA
jgi:hypothetical protein